MAVVCLTKILLAANTKQPLGRHTTFRIDKVNNSTTINTIHTIHNMAKGRPTNINSVTTVAEPTDMDVLCSKDKSVAKHPGNVIFRERIELGTVLYASTSSKQDKMRITREIVSYMQDQYGSRFLKKTPGDVWVEISDQTARDKVSHALRFAAKNQGQGSSGSVTITKKTVKKGYRKGSIDTGSTVSSSASTSSQSYETNIALEDVRIPSNLSKLSDNKDPLHLPVASIFLRQQNILDSMQGGGGILDFNEFQSMSLANVPTPEFNTLRSEDLNELLSGPMFSSGEEWETVQQMAEC